MDESLKKIVYSPFDVNHSSSDINALIQLINSVEGESRIVMEYTGRYYEVLAHLNEQVLSYLLKNDKLPKAIILKQIYGDKTIVIDGLDELLISVFINHANFAFEPDQLSILANLE